MVLLMPYQAGVQSRIPEGFFCQTATKLTSALSFGTATMSLARNASQLLMCLAASASSLAQPPIECLEPQTAIAENGYRRHASSNTARHALASDTYLPPTRLRFSLLPAIFHARATQSSSCATTGFNTASNKTLYAISGFSLWVSWCLQKMKTQHDSKTEPRHQVMCTWLRFCTDLPAVGNVCH